MGSKIWLLWKESYVFEVLVASNQMISGWITLDNARILVSFVYAKCTRTEQRELWDFLRSVQTDANPWLIVGDFNITREDNERIGGYPRASQAMDDFNECIDVCGMVELRYVGNRMSWCNGQERTSRRWARLDKALVNMPFSSRFTSASLMYLQRKAFDHSPMVIQFSELTLRYGPMPFRFQNMWCSHDAFFSFVKSVWEKPAHGSGLVKLVAKL